MLFFYTQIVQLNNTNVKSVENASELTKFAMVLKTVLTIKRTNGHVRKNLPNALDQQKFVMASKIVITMRMKKNAASTVS